MTFNRQKEMEALSLSLGLEGLNLDLLSMALTHPSYMIENPGALDNQRLEFLGDAAVDLVIGECLYHAYPSEGEGVLSKKRATLVCEEALASAARRLELGKYLRLGKGERASGGASRASNLADAWEAMCAVIFLSLGITPLYALHETYLKPEIEKVHGGYYGDYKTRLQEVVQKDAKTATYRLLSTRGPEHNKIFCSEVLIEGEPYGLGRGRTKKASEREAAFYALVRLGELDGEEK